MAGRSVIHKQVIDLESIILHNALTGEDALSFEVPKDAELVDVQWDTRARHGIGFWYKTAEPDANAAGQEVKFWRFLVVGTGHSFPTCMTHQATVVRDGYAWHILDADGGHISWADL